MRIAVVLVVLSAIAHADAPRDAIERARELEQQLAYEEALAIIDAAIRAGQSDRDRLVELHLIAGRLNAGLDRAKPAEEHFAIVLALRPSTTLPDGTSPKIAVPFTRARTTSVALDVKLVVAPDHVAIEPTDPLGIVGGIAVRYRSDTHVERGVLRVERRPGAIEEVRALDRHGNVVWTGAPPAVVEKPVEKKFVVDDPPFMARWSTWAVVGGVALAAGGLAAWRFDSAQNEFDSKRAEGMTDFTDLQAIEDRGRRWALVANIGFGVAAASTIASVIFFVRRPAPVTITAGPGTVGVVGRF